MYLEYFNLKEMPFTLTPNVGFFCNLPTYQEALNTLLVSLRSGEGFIKITGEVGTGKTLLCRKLLASLGDDFVTAYIPNPDLSPTGLRKAFAKELGIEKFLILDQHALLEMINEKLLNLHYQGKRVVLLLDEAQALSTESLDAIRLLTNLETETTKLLQVVLFGQPELDTRLNQTCLRQLKQRISFSYKLKPLSQEGLKSYLCHRLVMAGYTHGSLFSTKAVRLLFKSSQGLPRIVNVLSHKALLVAYGRGEDTVSYRSMQMAIKDTLSDNIFTKITLPMMVASGILLGFFICLLALT